MKMKPKNPMVEKMQRRDKLREKRETSPRNNKDGRNPPNPIIAKLKEWVGQKVVVQQSNRKTVVGVLEGVSFQHLNLLVKTENDGEIVFRNFASVKLFSEGNKEGKEGEKTREKRD